jgi:hypothetical protein
MEAYALYLQIAGVAVAAVGLLWLFIASVRAWGWWVFLLPPASLFLIFARFGKAILPVVVLLLGAGLFFYPWAHAKLFPIDLGPYERVVEGEVHLTLTGWDQKDYSILKTRTDIVVLQMANADVTDETLTYLEGMANLRELDLNHTAITDGGLAILAKLPKLETLRLGQTRVTDQGLLTHLKEAETLKKLDVENTEITREARREWRQAKPGRVTNPR